MLFFYSFLFPTNLLFKVRMVASLVMTMNGHLNMSTTPNGCYSSTDVSNHNRKKGEVVAAISPGMFLFLLSFLLTTTIVGLCNGLKRVQIDRIYMPLFGP